MRKLQLIMPDRTPSPKPRVAFGSGVPAKPSSQERESPSRVVSGESVPLEESQRSSRSRTPTTVSNQTPNPPDRWKGGTLPSEPRQSPKGPKVKVTHTHIGSGSDTEIRHRLRQTLSVNSVRIEPEDDGAGLSNLEVSSPVQLRVRVRVISTDILIDIFVNGCRCGCWLTSSAGQGREHT